MTSLHTYQNEKCFLEAEWVINIQTPVQDLDNFAKVLGDKVTLKQGNYSHCMYIRRGGHCRFMGNEGHMAVLNQRFKKLTQQKLLFLSRGCREA